MRFNPKLMAGAAICGLMLPITAFAADADEDADSARQARSDIIVIGKSYGAEVGKTVTPLKDIPNTVTVIDRGQIEAQGLFTLEDVMTATNGITVTGVGSEDPSYMSRGFAINNYLMDGVAVTSPAVMADMFFYDRIEVLRGPAGLFSGSGNPAGSLNLVRKRPLDELSVKAMAGYGSYENKRFELDVSTPLTSIGGVRAGVMVQDQDQFFDTAHRNRLAAFVTGSVELDTKTTLTFGGSYDRYKPAIQSGLPGFIGGADGSDGQLLDISRSTYLGADWNRFHSDVWSAFGELSHRFNDDWALRATGLVTSTRRKDNYSYIGSQPISDANEGWTNHIAYASDNSYWARSADVNLIGRFQMFGQDQSLILGADYQANNDKSYYTRLSNYARINVYDPVSPAEPPLNPYASSPPYETWDGRLVSQSIGGSQTDTKQFGAYGQISLSPLAGLTFVGGGRFTWWETQTRALLPTVAAYSGYKVKGRFTPYGGVVWDVTNSWNIYGSYADSFTPQTSTRRRPDGQAIKPLVGAQYEIGSKLSLFDEKLLLSVAGYQITQSNRLYTNDTELGPDIVLQIGKVRSRGIEAEIGGEVLPGWRVNGGYSYTKTKYLEDSNPLFEGLSFVPIIPKHSIKMFTNYAPETGPLAGFSIGGSVTWFTSTFGGNAATYRADNSLNARSTIVRQDAYIVADARAGYKFSDQLSLSVNVNNLFDRTYYSRISSTSRGNYFGSPRTVMATLRLAYP